MGLKKFRPFTPTRRHAVLPDYSELTRSKPKKSLTERIYKTGGRNNRGHVSMRWIGRGHKQRYRLIDFRRDKDGVPAKVVSIEYDRTARPASPSSAIATASSATSWRRTVSRSASC